MAGPRRRLRGARRSHRAPGGGQLVRGLQIKAVPWTLVLRGDGTAKKAWLGRQSYDTLRGAL